MERCCIAQRPASVRSVITTVETAHNTGRQSKEEESNRRGKKKKKEEEIEKNTLMQTKQSADKLLLFLRIIYHLAIQGESLVSVSYCLSLKCLCDKATPARVTSFIQLATGTNTEHRDATSTGAAITPTNAPFTSFCPFFLVAHCSGLTE